MEEPAVAGPGILTMGELEQPGVARQELGREGGQPVALQGEGVQRQGAGEHRAAKHSQPVVGEVQGEKGWQGGELGGLQPGQEVVAGERGAGQGGQQRSRSPQVNPL